MGEKRNKREKRKPAVTEFIAGDNVTVRVRGKVKPGDRQWIEVAVERLERDLPRDRDRDRCFGCGDTACGGECVQSR